MKDSLGKRDRGMPIRLQKEPLLEASGKSALGVKRHQFSNCSWAWYIKICQVNILTSFVFRGQTFHLPSQRLTLRSDMCRRSSMEGSNYSVQIGEHMVSLSCRRPYSGWVDFSKEIRSLAYVLRSTMLIERLERFSLKYIDLIELKQPPNLECLDVDLKLGGSRIDTGPVQFRSELKEQGLTHIIQIVCPAKVDLPGDRAFIGVLLDIDTIHPIPLTDSNTEKDKAWDIVDRSLDTVHAASKSMFFKLLTAKTVESLEPVYSEDEVL